MSVVIERVLDREAVREILGSSPSVVPTKPEVRPRWAVIGLIGLRLAIGFEFLWAFFDKTFGLGFATPTARAWLNGGSPTKGFLSHASGPLSNVFGSLAGVSAIDWLFMLGLLGAGLALVLGVAVRAGAVAGVVMLLTMYVAVWLPTTTPDGTGNATNPIIDEHIIAIFGLILVATLVNWSGGYLGRKWASLPIVKTRPWLR